MLALGVWLMAVVDDWKRSTPRTLRRTLPWMFLVFLAFVGCVMTVGCTPYDVRSPSVTPPPTVAERDFIHKACPDCMKFDPPPFYGRWWQHAENCTGYRGRMDKITWLLAPKPFLRLKDDPNWYLGMYWPDQGIIVLGLFREADSVTVIHEDIHALIDQNGVRDDQDQHPKLEFDEKCGKLIGRA